MPKVLLSSRILLVCGLWCYLFVFFCQTFHLACVFQNRIRDLHAAKHPRQFLDTFLFTQRMNPGNRPPIFQSGNGHLPWQQSAADE